MGDADDETTIEIEIEIEITAERVVTVYSFLYLSSRIRNSC